MLKMLKKKDKENRRSRNPLKETYYYVSDRDAIDGYTAVTHTLILGQTGACKTTSSGALVQKSHIANGDGGLVLTSKPSDVEDTLSYARACGREGDVVRITPHGEDGIDALDYIYQTSGDDFAITCTDFLAKLMRLGRRRGGSSSGDQYFQDAKEELATNLIIINAGATNTVNVMTMMDILQSLPRSTEELKNPDFRNNSFAMQAIQKAEIAAYASNKPGVWAQYEMAMKALLVDFVRLPSRTREGVVSNFASSIHPLRMDPLRSALSSGQSTITPEMTHTTGNKILVIDTPTTQDQGGAAVFINATWKYLWQQSVMRREIVDSSPISFCFVDEAAETFFPESDARAMRLLRGFRGASCFISQSIKDFEGVVDGSASRAQVSSLLDQMALKIVHCCSGETAEYMSSLIGSRESYEGDWNRGENDRANGESGTSHGFSMKRVRKPVVTPETFQQLRMGHEGVSDAVVFQSGRRFQANKGESWILTGFKPTWAK